MPSLPSANAQYENSTDQKKYSFNKISKMLKKEINRKAVAYIFVSHHYAPQTSEYDIVKHFRNRGSETFQRDEATALSRQSLNVIQHLKKDFYLLARVNIVSLCRHALCNGTVWIADSFQNMLARE